MYLQKIRPVVDKLNKDIMQFDVFSENISIDEQMMRYYGHRHT